MTIFGIIIEIQNDRRVLIKKNILILLFLPIVTLGQFIDSFSDGDFINNPNWLGDVSVFEVDTAFFLHLNDTIANTSSLVTESECVINAEWSFRLRLDFSPSTNNYARVYLISDMQDLRGNLNGYFVKIGGQTGLVDEISLYSQSGNNHIEIIDGIDGLASDHPDMGVKVTRDSLGNWELFVDTNGVFFSQGIALDNSPVTSNYFGVFCKYTITRADKFWFDDFNVSGLPPVYGCTDILACNYNMLANFDDGSCDFPEGCGDPQYVEYDPLVTCSDPLDCITLITSTIEQAVSNSKRILKTVDILGKEIKQTNQPVFHIYDDGTVEKQILIE